MISGIGVDIVKNQRFESWIGDRRRLERYFSPSEIEWCLSQREGAAASLAARFAAREAFGKAMGTGIRGFALLDIRVHRDDAGKPAIELSGAALERFEQMGGGRIHLSLAHERDFAVAMVVIEEVVVH